MLQMLDGGATSHGRRCYSPEAGCCKCREAVLPLVNGDAACAEGRCYCYHGVRRCYQERLAMLPAARVGAACAEGRCYHGSVAMLL